MKKQLTIGEVAERCGVSNDTLRYYESRGLIAEPPRFKSSGYRAYPPETVEQVQFVRQAQQLGFSLDEIGDLLQLKANDLASCAQVQKVARAKIEEIRIQIKELENVVLGLQELVNICPGDVPVDHCPFIEMLSNKE